MYILMNNGKVILESIASEKEAIDLAMDLSRKENLKIQVVKILGEVVYEPHFKKVSGNTSTKKSTKVEPKEWEVVQKTAKTFAVPELKEIEIVNVCDNISFGNIEDISEKKLQDLEQKLQDVKHPFEIPLKELETNEKEESVGIEKTFEVQEIGDVNSSEKIFTNSLGFTMSEENVKKQTQTLFKEALEQEEPLVALGNEIEKMCNWYKDDLLHEYKWFRDLCDEYQVLATQKLGAISNLNAAIETKEVKEDSNDDIHFKNLQTLKDMAKNPNYKIETIERLLKSPKNEALINTKYKDEYEKLVLDIKAKINPVEEKAKDSIDILQEEFENNLRAASLIDEVKVLDVINNTKFTEFRIKRKNVFQELKDFYFNEGKINSLIKNLLNSVTPEEFFKGCPAKIQKEPRLIEALNQRKNELNNTNSDALIEIKEATKDNFSVISIKYAKDSLENEEIKIALKDKEKELGLFAWNEFLDLIKDKSNSELVKLASKYEYLSNTGFRSEWETQIAPKVQKALVEQLLKELPSVPLNKLQDHLKKYRTEVVNDSLIQEAIASMKTSLICS